jgi:outer membrane protein OmpA-like peptidoglycan-associated protein
MKISFALFACAAATTLLIAGCATPPPVRQPTTTVILMPDEDGHVGAVSVSTDAGTQQINEAFSASTVTGVHGKPSASNALKQDAVTASYDSLLKAQPPKPISFTLYFHLDRTTLTDESKAMIPAVLAAVRERKPTEISIFGHTDSIGTEKRNVKLSADRARVIAAMLMKDDPTLDHIEQQFFGDRLPLVNSGTKAEPRNRRAEIQIL